MGIEKILDTENVIAYVIWPMMMLMMKGQMMHADSPCIGVKVQTNN